MSIGIEYADSESEGAELATNKFESYVAAFIKKASDEGYELADMKVAVVRDDNKEAATTRVTLEHRPGTKPVPYELIVRVEGQRVEGRGTLYVMSSRISPLRNPNLN